MSVSSQYVIINSYDRKQNILQRQTKFNMQSIKFCKQFLSVFINEKQCAESYADTYVWINVPISRISTILNDGTTEKSNRSQGQREK